MSEHTWVIENLAAYVAGGLAAEERERLQQHAADCAECGCALKELRAADAELEALFAPVRPGPELEDRSIDALRRWPPRRQRSRFVRATKAILAVAAAVLLAVLGAGLGPAWKNVPFPGDAVEQDKPPPEGESISVLVARKNIDMGTYLKEPGELFTEKQVAKATEPKGALASLNELKAKYLKRSLLKDEWVRSDDLTDAVSSITWQLPEGQRAIGIRASTEGIAGGWASLPGSRVDLVSTVRRGDEAYSQVLVQDVPVLAADGAKQKQEGGGALPASVVTLGLNSEDALKVTLASQLGPLHVMVRKHGDKTRTENERATVTQLSRGTNSDNDSYFKPGDVLSSKAAGAVPGKVNINNLGDLDSFESLAEKNQPARAGAAPAVPEAARADKSGLGAAAGGAAMPAGSKSSLALARPIAPQPEQQKEPAPTVPESAGRKIIRSGEIDFEIDSFDNAVAVITRLIGAAKGGFIATINSEKLPNGKVRGSVVVRIPPEKLDAFVLDLRKELAKMGDLKGQRIGSEDISKKYTDLESQLRAARTMEERLLKIIKEGKGQVKDLVLAEKELGNWRTSVEKLEGELRYYAHQVALSTLTINLTEKEIRQAAVITESERVTTGIEVEDVESAFRAALAAVAEANGRVTKSDLKQHSAGQYSAVLHFEVPPDAAGTVRDRLKQLGTVARLDIDRVQQAEGGELAVKNGRLKRGPTQFLVSLYNLVNVAPRETVVLRVAAGDVAAAYRTLRAAVEKVQGRVTNAALNEQDQQNISAQLDFDIRRASEEPLQSALAGAGETLSRQLTRQPAGENVTDAKVQFNVVLVSARTIPPRETSALVVEVADVDTALAVLAAQVREAGGRSEAQQRHQDPNGRVTVQAPYVVPLTAAPGLLARVRTTGRVREQRDATNEQAPAGKLALARLEVTWTNAEQLVPGEAGLWAQLRRGLSLSLRGLAVSASWLIVGVLVVLPWVLLVYFIVWLVRRLWRSRDTSRVTAPSSSGPA